MSIENISLTKEVSHSYLEYSLASIQRAIPDYRDGLLPIHRRIIWGAYKAGFSSESQFKKCSRLSGEVGGKYSPHGDCYGSIVTLASKWNNNYPLLNGHGNFGSSVDSAAAGRYTETKLQRFTEETLLEEIDVLELKDNYDGTRKEPIYLSAKLPILLLKGAASIAVGYATHIPQYNLKEICDYLLNKKVELLPDFPSGPLICEDKDNKNNIYQRATITNETIEIIGKRKKKEYVKVEFSNLPYGSNPEKIGEQIKKLVQKELISNDGIIAVEDLSDKNGDCISITIDNSQKDNIISILYKNTDLQSTFNINFTILLDGIPKTMTPTEYLDLWKSWRLKQIIKYNELILQKLIESSVLLKDIIKVLSNKKQLIKILEDKNNSYKDCLEKISAFYKIDIKSTEFFLNQPIKKLSSIEINKYIEELKQNEESQLQCKENINNPEQKFIKEIKYFSKKYELNRKSKISNFLISKEDVNSNKEKKINTSPSKGFSINTNKGIINKGNDYFHPVIAICSDGKAYRISPNSRGPIAGKPVKVLFVITDDIKSKYSSTKVLELLDDKSKVGKCVKLDLLTATSKGTPLGFENITNAKLVSQSQTKLKIMGKSSKPKSIK